MMNPTFYSDNPKILGKAVILTSESSEIYESMES